MNRFFIFLLFATATYGQYTRYDNIAFSPSGGPAAFASIAVCSQPANAVPVPCTPVVPLYGSTTGGPIINPPIIGGGPYQPILADQYGNYHFYILPGIYTIQISGNPLLGSFVMPDQSIGVSVSSTTTATNLAGPGTVNGAYSFTGPETFTGINTHSALETFSNINAVRHVNLSASGFPSISSALATCPSAPNGCHIIVDDGTTLTNVTSFSLGITPCQNFFAQVLELGVNTSISMNGPITLNCGGYIYGDNRDGNNIVTSGSFPASNPMVVMGDTACSIGPTNCHAIDARIEGVELNCNSVSLCTGISAFGLNENSTIGRIAISNYGVGSPTTGVGNCISIDGTNAPSTSNYIVYDIDCLNGGSSNDSIYLKNAGTDLIQRITLVANGGIQTSGAGIHITGNAAGNFNGHTIITVHCEKHNDCVLADGNQGTALTYVDAENGTVNGLRLAATANGAVTANYVRNNSNSSNPSVINQVTGTTITSSQVAGGVVPLYTWSISQSEWFINNTGVHGPNIPIVASLTTTSATSDNVALVGMTSSGHCQFSPTNATAATNYVTTYVSAKTTNQITVTHTATSGMTYDIFCSPN